MYIHRGGGYYKCQSKCKKKIKKCVTLKEITGNMHVCTQPYTPDPSIVRPSEWLLTGNNMSPGDFLGSKNNILVEFRTNDIIRMIIESGGNINIINSLNVGNNIILPKTVTESPPKGVIYIRKTNGNVETIESFIHNYGTHNVFVGESSGNFELLGTDNISMGYMALNMLDQGSGNVALGSNSLWSNTTGSNNIAVGYQAGQLIESNSDNICIDNDGSATGDGVIRIGNSNHTSCFVQGIHGVTPGGTTQNVIIDENGNLVIGGGGTEGSLTGNTIMSGDFLGTINDQDLVIKTGSTPTTRMTVKSDGNVEIQNELTVDDNVTLNNGLDVTGNATVSGTTTLANTLTVTGKATLNNGLDVTGNATVSGTTTLANTLTVTGKATLNNGLDVTSGDVDIDNNLTVGGLLYADGGIDVTATGGTDILNIGTANANTLNLGTANMVQTINIGIGTATKIINICNEITDTVNVTGTLNVTDHQIILNKGGGFGAGAGIVIEKQSGSGDNDSYIKTNGTKDGWLFRAPDTTNDVEMKPNSMQTTGVVYGTTGSLTSGYKIKNADVDNTAGIVDTKLATISTAGKVDNTATTATSSNTTSAIVSRDGSGDFSAGTLTINNIKLPTTTSSLGIIYSNNNPFIHNKGTGNTFVGENAGNLSNITGNYNTGVGGSTLAVTTSGTGNVATGSYALYTNITGYDNVAIGTYALYNNTEGYYNIANGTVALYNNITGYDNIANGYMALYTNTAGAHNIANGYMSLFSNEGGHYNIASGYQALYSNTDGDDNIAIGREAMRNSTGGTYNIANGYQSLYSNTTGNYNIANGYQSLFTNDTGSNNIANGYQSLYSNIAGTDNIANGRESLYSNTAGSGNIANGRESLFTNTAGNTNIANGYQALYYNTTGHANIANGYEALQANTTGSYNIALGYQAGNNLTTGDYNICIGNTGVVLEANIIRIGTNGTHTSCYIQGIYDQTTALGTNVYVDSSGKLTRDTSSIKYKDNVLNVPSISDKIDNLRPVSFTYKTDKDSNIQYGLIAEEIESEFPELVIYKDGEPDAIRYQHLPILMLKDYQDTKKELAETKAKLEETNSKLDSVMDELTQIKSMLANLNL